MNKFTLNADNYYEPISNKKYFSSSQIKSFEECPARAMAEIEGAYSRPKTTPMLVGSFVDSYFDGTLETFKAENPEIFNSRNGELKADFRHALKVIEAIERQPKS